LRRVGREGIITVSTIAANRTQTQQSPEVGGVDRERRSLSPGTPGLDVLARDFDELHALVYRYLLHRFFDPELAEELTAQTFYNAAVRISRRPGDIRRVRAWLLRAATNLANTHCRRRRLRQFFLRQFARTKAETTEPQPASDSPAGQRSARVRGVLLALRPKYQTVVALRYYAQMSYAEMAEVLGCREDAVRARLSRALKEMRERLGSGGVCDVPNTPRAR
jgi:RNA polymerase sigma-70 factor (ECF subfamily)